MSLNAYVDQGAVDSLEDQNIAPRPDSINPYVAGARRYATRADTGSPSPPRRRCSRAERPGRPDANPGAVQELIYRVYLPDRAADAATRALPDPACCCPTAPELRGRQVLRRSTTRSGTSTSRRCPRRCTTRWCTPALIPSPTRHSTRCAGSASSTPLALSIFRYDTPSQDLRKKDLALGEVGGFYDNRAVKYTVGPINAAFGDVLVLRGKLPRTPRTGPGVTRMGRGQMRYWSICQNTSPVETQGSTVSMTRRCAVSAGRPAVHDRGEPSRHSTGQRPPAVRGGVAELG